MFGVVGATGRTGSVVVDALLARGADVRVIVRRESAASVWRSRGAQVAVASLEDERSSTQAFTGLEGLYVLLPEDRQRPDFHAWRRGMTQALAAAIRTSEVPHVVALSTFAAVLPEGNGPAADLHELERSLASTGCVLTTLRGAFFQENVAMAIAPARHQGVFPTLASEPSRRIPTVATRDVGRAAAIGLLEPPARSETIGLAGPAYSVDEMALLLGRQIGRELTVVTIPREAQQATLVASGLSEELAAGLVDMQECVESGRVPFHADRWVDCATRLEDVLPGLVP